MTEEKKYCWICKHIEIDSGWSGSECTPGDPSVLMCGLGHWDIFDRMYSRDPAGLGKCLSMAQTCKDLELGHWMTGEKLPKQSTGECVMVCTPGEPNKIIELKE